MKVFITGSSGFIGYNLFNYLKSKGHDVIGIDNFSNSKPIKDIINLDVQDKYISEFIENGKFNVVIHLAAMGSIKRCKDNQTDCFNNNVSGFLNVFKAVMDNKVPLFLYASSSSIYNEDEESHFYPDKPRHELERIMPDETISLYGSTKLINEMIGRMGNTHLGVKSIGLRLFNVFGPGQRHDVEYPAFIPKVVNCLYKNEIIPLYNEGNNKRDFTPVQYVCAVIDRLLVKYKSFGEPVLNIGYGDPKSCVDIISRLEKMTGKEARFEMKPARTELDYSRASTYLLNQLNVEQPDFDTCLLDTVKYYQSCNGNRIT